MPRVTESTQMAETRPLRTFKIRDFARIGATRKSGLHAAAAVDLDDIAGEEFGVGRGEE